MFREFSATGRLPAFASTLTASNPQYLILGAAMKSSKTPVSGKITEHPAKDASPERPTGADRRFRSWRKGSLLTRAENISALESARSTTSPRCLFSYSDSRRQCRTPRQSGHPHFCFFHARKEAQARAADQAGR